MDLHRQEDIAIQVECASVQLNNPKFRKVAEAILVSFKTSPNAIVDSKYILLHCSSPLAQFHAAVALKEMSIRRWNEATHELHTETQVFILEYLANHYFHLKNFVTSQLLQTFSVLYKRHWLDATNDHKTFIFNYLVRMLNSNIMFHQLVALKLFFCIVTEFRVERSSVINMPYEFHLQTRRSLEHDYLFRIASTSFCFLKYLLSNLSNEVSMEILSVCFELCNELLCWNFAYQRESEDIYDASIIETSISLICPAKEWHDLIIQQSLLHQIFQTYNGVLRQLNDERLQSSCRQLFINFALLDGSVFYQPSEKASFLLFLFESALELRMTSEFATWNESVDMCHLFEFIVFNLRFKGIVQYFRAKWFLNELTSFSCLLIRLTLDHALKGSSVEESPSSFHKEAFDHILNTWNLLLNDSIVEESLNSVSFVYVDSNLRHQALHFLSDVLRPLIPYYIQMELSFADITSKDPSNISQNYDIDELIFINDELDVPSLLARVNAHQSLTYCNEILSIMLKQFDCEFASSFSHMNSMLASLYKQLGWLITFTSCILADARNGEQPSIPAAVQKISILQNGNQDQSVTTEIEQDIVVQVSQTFLKSLKSFTEKVKGDPLSNKLSPRYACQILNAMERWSTSFLIPDKELYRNISSYLNVCEDFWLSSSILLAFGDERDGGNGRHIINFLVESVCVFLCQWPKQNAVTNSALKLLECLACDSNGATGILISLPIWSILLDASFQIKNSISSKDSENLLKIGIRLLPLEVRGRLAKIILRGGLNTNDDIMRLSYFQKISQPIKNQFHMVTSQVIQSSSLQDNEDFFLLLELYRGFATAAEHSPCKIVIEFCLSVLPTLVILFDNFYNNSKVASTILSVFCDLIESQITFLEPEDAIQVYHGSGKLFEVFYKHSFGKMSISGDMEDEKISNVSYLFKLLSLLLSKKIDNISNINCAENSSWVALADVVLYGLKLVLAIITNDILDYPSICQHYFEIISFMIKVYPEKLGELSSASYHCLMHSLKSGVQHMQSHVAKLCLTAIGDLANFHVKGEDKGYHILAAKAGDRNSGFFLDFLQILFQVIIFQDNVFERLDWLAYALFPLIFSDQNRYRAVATDISSQQKSFESQQRLNKAFDSLLDIEFDCQSIRSSRLNRQKLKLKLVSFITRTRGFLRIK